MAKLLIGIDIGTSACKAAAFDSEGTVLAQASRPYQVYHLGQGWVEQDPMEWWQKACEAVRAVVTSLSARGIPAAHIGAVGVDGQSWSAIPIDRQGRVLHNTPNWMDNRAHAICERIKREIGSTRFVQSSGNSFEPTYSTPKIMWFKENKPEIFNQTAKFLQSNSFIVYRLTGQITQDLSQGYGLHVFNIHNGTYDDELCDRLGIPIEMLPPIHPCHEVVGTVTPQAAAETGLSPGTPVVAGGLDAACGTLGAGVIFAGKAQEQGGQAGGMSICIDRVHAHPRLILSFHVVPGMYLLQGGTVGGGGTLKWFKEQLGAYEVELEKQTGRDAFEVFSELAAAVKPGSDGLVFLPYMAGERSPIWDVHAKGVLYGLSYDKTKAHLVRAIMEGCAYALLHNLETAEEAGVAAKVLNAVGGAANSEVWTQIKSNVTGKEIQVPASDTATTLGAAILAGVGVGVYRDFREAVQKTIRIKRVHHPDEVNHKVYQRYYQLYRELYQQLQGLMQKYGSSLEGEGV